MKNKRVYIYIIIVLVIVIGIFIFFLKPKTKEKTKEENIKIVKNDIKLEEYKTDVFTMKKPVNWNVETSGTGVYYAIRVYDTKNTNNQIFLMIKMQPLLKSETSKNSWKNYYKLSGYDSRYKVFSEAVVLNKPTVEEFYKKFNDISTYMKNIDPLYSNMNFPVFKEFNKLEEFDSKASMKSVSLDSKVLRATFKGENDKLGEGLFMASVVNFGNQNTMGVDMSYYMVYDIMAITSDNDEFINYKDILLESINSINFTDTYVKKTIDDNNQQTKQSLELNASIQKAFDSYMSSWENRNKTYDIISQKRSDATLGYERVYNTETNEIYKAYNGFTDDYDTEKYKAITDDMYTEKITGYIEK